MKKVVWYNLPVGSILNLCQSSIQVKAGGNLGM